MKEKKCEIKHISDVINILKANNISWILNSRSEAKKEVISSYSLYDPVSSKDKVIFSLVEMLYSGHVKNLLPNINFI